MASSQKITPFLWFDQQAEEAARFYVSVFEGSSVDHLVHQGDAVLVANFNLAGESFNALNGGPLFQFNPSVSFFAYCDTEAETRKVWQSLTEGGFEMMPLDRYDWSECYGFCQDRYGLAWQVSLRPAGNSGPKFVPSLLFTGAQCGKAEAALRRYAEVFGDTAIDVLAHYEAGEHGTEGTLKYGQIRVGEQVFCAMDNPMDQHFAFNEAISFVIHCDGQAEIDYYWNQLTANGGEESQCGWLKDAFGVSWQVVPKVLPTLLGNPDPAVAQYAGAALMKMRKIVIADLQA